MAFFVPHEGCPHQCSFCDQKAITGISEKITGAQVTETLKQAAKLQNRDSISEIAFFGGSFTAIAREYQEELLQAAYPFVKDASFAGIRVSTRPDAIDDSILRFLKKYRVTAIELGAQSMDNRVLQRNHRGHTAEDVELASRKIRGFGFSLGLQMMTGLYGSDDASDETTAERLILCKPDYVRIYPTAVLRGTRLAELYQRGSYRPPTTEEAIPLCARLLGLFQAHGIPVIRLGLHDTPELRQDLLAGAYHPAFREKCEAYLFYQEILAHVVCDKTSGKNVTIFGNPRDVSKIIGQKRENVEKLKQLGISAKVISDPSLPQGEIQVKCR